MSDFKKCMLQLIEQAKEVKYDLYPQHLRNYIQNYTHETIDLFLTDIKVMVETFRKKKDPNLFQTSYYGKIVLNAEVYFGLLFYHRGKGDDYFTIIGTH